MKRYEYKLVPASLTLFRNGEEALNEYGKEGWRFISIEAGKAVFEREITKNEVFLTIIENPFGNDAIVGVHKNKGDAISMMESKDNICKEEGFPYSHRVERHDVK